MSRPTGPKLQVSSAGARNYITVGMGRSTALLSYLRGHLVRCDPPEPSSVGQDTIELGRHTDVRKVQALLDGWA